MTNMMAACCFHQLRHIKQQALRCTRECQRPSGLSGGKVFLLLDESFWIKLHFDTLLRPTRFSERVIKAAKR
jgi:hypothetical protein